MVDLVGQRPRAPVVVALDGSAAGGDLRLDVGEDLGAALILGASVERTSMRSYSGAGVGIVDSPVGGRRPTIAGANMPGSHARVTAEARYRRSTIVTCRHPRRVGALAARSTTPTSAGVWLKIAKKGAADADRQLRRGARCGDLPRLDRRSASAPSTSRSSSSASRRAARAASGHRSTARRRRELIDAGPDARAGLAQVERGQGRRSLGCGLRAAEPGDRARTTSSRRSMQTRRRGSSSARSPAPAATRSSIACTTSGTPRRGRKRIADYIELLSERRTL